MTVQVEIFPNEDIIIVDGSPVSLGPDQLRFFSVLWDKRPDLVSVSELKAAITSPSSIYICADYPREAAKVLDIHRE